jgi:hypothetical protein
MRLLLPAAAALFGLLATSGISMATMAISKKEGSKPCLTCHEKAGKKDLNEVGKYYKEKKTLVGAPKK